MSFVPLRVVAASALLAFAACATTAPTRPQTPVEPVASSEPEIEPVASASSSVEPLASASASASASTAAKDSGPKSCPEDMVLIDGDYCTELQLKCLKSHYAKQNDKTICHEFESPSKCVGKKVHKRYCIDKYEFPNKKGEFPQTMADFPAAQKLCAAQNKRVCTETEWTMACEGPEYKPYPYGYARDPNKCRGDREYRHPKKMKNGMLLTHSPNKEKAQAEIDRLYDAVRSGSQPDCVSDYGVYDMPGNADELAASETPEPKSKYLNVTTGGPWVDGVRNQCRPKIYTHNEGFSYYYLSFRCCAETDNKPTDPRSPKEIKNGSKWRN